MANTIAYFKEIYTQNGVESTLSREVNLGNLTRAQAFERVAEISKYLNSNPNISLQHYLSTGGTGISTPGFQRRLIGLLNMNIGISTPPTHPQYPFPTRRVFQNGTWVIVRSDNGQVVQKGMGTEYPYQGGAPVIVH